MAEDLPKIERLGPYDRIDPSRVNFQTGHTDLPVYDTSKRRIGTVTRVHFDLESQEMRFDMEIWDRQMTAALPFAPYTTGPVLPAPRPGPITMPDHATDCGLMAGDSCDCR